jgi:hypothetical protein
MDINKSLAEGKTALKNNDDVFWVGSSNKINWNPLPSGSALVCMVAQRSGDGPVSTGNVDKIAAKAKSYGCGNCFEKSAVAFVYLRDKGIKPLDWVTLLNGDHAFVLIGRSDTDHGSGTIIDVKDLDRWAKNVAVCDPWAEKVYVADQLLVNMKGMFSSNPFKGSALARVE